MIEDVGAAAWDGRTPDGWRRDWRIPSLHILDTTTSTNDVAMRLAAGGAAAGTVVIADRQTHGRGRDGRKWTDAPGLSLLVSIVLRTVTPNTDPSVMPLRVGLATARAIEVAAGIQTRIKWPNDVLSVDGRKIAGVLCEGATSAGHGWLVAGIGINVSQHAQDLEPGIREAAASIAMLGGSARRCDLAAGIIDGLRPFDVMPPPLDPQTLREIHGRDALRGRRITIDGSPAGTADGITPDGQLRLRHDGNHRTIRAGTIRLAPADPAGNPGANPQIRPEANR